MIKNLVIFGDSYSTFEGYIPEGFATYYSSQGRGPEQPVTKMDVKDTWWMRLIDKTDGVLLHNNSWSGSTLCYTGYDGDCSHSSSFIYRYRQLKAQGFFEKNEVNTLFVFGGTNDSWANAPLGQLKYSDWTEEDLFNVLPAFCYFMHTLKTDLPNTRIVFLMNTIKPEIVEGAIRAGKYFGVEVIALDEVDKCNGHPTKQGMEEICNQIIKRL